MYEWWNLFFTDMHVFAATLVIGAGIIFMVGMGMMGGFSGYQSCMETAYLRHKIRLLEAMRTQDTPT